MTYKRKQLRFTIDEYNLLTDGLNDTLERLKQGQLADETLSYIDRVKALKTKVERHLS